MNKPLSRYWLLIGVAALAVAGLFSLILIVARTPSVSDFPLVSSLFHESLVVHVDLSVLVWFLSIACMAWSVLAAPSRPLFPYIEEAALVSFALGTLAIAASPLDPHAVALMSNYIPVLMSPVFFIGLSLIACGVMLMLARLFAARQWTTQFSKATRFAFFSSGIIALVGMISFAWSFERTPPMEDQTQYYETAFWGGGHVLQFMHTQMVLACWLLLGRALKPAFHVPRLALLIILTFGLATSLLAPLSYVLYDLNSSEHWLFFMHSMMWFNGIAPIILVFFIIPLIWQARSKNALWSVLFMSVLLFIYGGALGELIEGQNVVIPAHYHGAIVGITLAFMGAAYFFLPQFGYRDVMGSKLAFWQPFVYGGGQLLHISGLAWSGGYGVLRKMPGGLDDLDSSVKTAMGLMGLGGVIAIIGGFMFVIVVAKSVYSAKRA